MRQWTNRHADLEGFSNDLTKSNIRIGSGVATIDLGPQGKFLIGVHEAPYLGADTTSLLSTAQARESGIWVDDHLMRHGGKQLIRVDETNIPLTVAEAWIVGFGYFTSN